MQKIFKKFRYVLMVALLLIGFGLTPMQSAQAQNVYGLIALFVDDPAHPNEVFTFDGAFGTFTLTDGQTSQMYQQYLGVSPGTYSFSTRIKTGHSVYLIYCGYVVSATCTTSLSNRSVTITTTNTTDSYVIVGFYRN